MNEAVKSAYAVHRSGDLARAVELYGAILRKEPENFDALYLLGFVHFQRAEFAQAERLMDKALAVNPQSLDAMRNRGLALLRLKRPDEALALFARALALFPNIPELHLARGQALAALERPRDAITAFAAALASKPEFAEAWNARGLAMLALNQPGEALQDFDKALSKAPSHAGLHNNRGNALASLKRHPEAIESYDRALALAPDDAGILNHRAIAQFQAKNYDSAARGFARLIALAPDHPYARGNLAASRLHLCDWHGLDETLGAVDAAVTRGERAVTPILYAAMTGSPELQADAARIWAADRYPPPPPLWRGERYGHKIIRIAYLSADFHAHATAALMAGVFEHHDRSRFEIYAVSFGPDDGSAMRQRVRGAFDDFHDLRTAGDRDIAEMLRAREIDIAVDLKGYTEEARPGILAYRPAPVQAQYLGFPGTMGADFIDYIVADNVVIPTEDRAQYREKIVELPGSYQCNDRTRAIAARTPARGECGLPESGFVFCCFNNNFKIQPRVFAIWMRLLRGIEESVLWLLEDNADAAAHLRRKAEAAGIAPARLVFAKRVGLEDHLARHRLADLFLDTLPYGAHTTASDALWAGLPVLTCQGASFAGRVAASLLLALDLPELVAPSVEIYEDLAAMLARNPDALALVKAKLLRNRETESLFDTARFTRNLESAFLAMHERVLRGEAPADIVVEEQA